MQVVHGPPLIEPNNEDGKIYWPHFFRPSTLLLAVFSDFSSSVIPRLPRMSCDVNSTCCISCPGVGLRVAALDFASGNRDSSKHNAERSPALCLGLLSQVGL